MELSALKFVSEKREKDFNKLNIYTAEELVRHYPRDYLDLRRVTLLKDAYHNDYILTKCEVLNVETNRTARRPYVKATCAQGGSMFTAIWFNQTYVAQKLKRGEFLFYGRVQNKYGMGCQMVNPSFESVDKNFGLKGIVPVYSLSGSLTQGIVRVAVRQALEKTRSLSHIPAPLQKKYGLMPLGEALKKVHCPSSREDIKRASERIALEEYFLLISAFKVIKGGREEVRTRRYSVTGEEVEKFVSRFKFGFTEGQKSAVNDIFKAVHSPRQMNMLLQGDVGSGKTAVALTGLYMAVKSGYQGAMLAPTEVLARQNAGLIKKLFPEYNVQCLTGSTPYAEKRAIKSGLASGEVNIVCGTHAVIQADVIFKDLAFAVCDEQHRFGVAQRSSLVEKGGGCDVLVMSATPIPRTLSLIFYGDLDVTTIKDKPRSRQDISTSIVSERKYNDMIKYVAEQAKLGNQTYFVCPKIEGDDEGTVTSVTELYEE
ncbi:MAG: DEAD/DEAH box helicase, partial [Clostridia bacterium]|nr:DEAD/DEAH box helicase [Clostridia bacterium]